MPRSYRKTRSHYVGEVMHWDGPVASVPFGWLVQDGSVQNIADYPLLAAHYGTLYGGDGVTTFGIPDRRGRTAVGVDGGAGVVGAAWAQSVGGTGGEEKHTQAKSEMAIHGHKLRWMSGGGDGTTRYIWRDERNSSYNLESPEAYAVPVNGSGGAANVMQPGIAGYWIVRAI